MVLKIDKLEGEAPANTGSNSESFDPPPKKHKVDKDQQGQAAAEKEVAPAVPLLCAGCKISDKDAVGALLLFDDPEEDEKDKKIGDEKRYCAKCIVGKKVRVFWPVDSQWYIANVQEYDTETGEHLLQYPDGDKEWVRIGEDHTTNTSYREYCSSLKGGNALQGSVSFPFSGLGRSMSQGLGVEGETMEPLKKDSMQQLNLDRSSSSMSSFGIGAAIGRQHSFHGHYPYGPTALPPFQLLSPNYTHSFSSRKGEEGGVKGEAPGAPYLYGAGSESWDGPPPNHQYRAQAPHPYDPRSQDRHQPPYPYEHPQHPYPRAIGDSKDGAGEAHPYYPPHPSYIRQQPPPPNSRPEHQTWQGHPPHYPPGYYNGQPPPMYSYPGHHPPPQSSEPPLISPATPDGTAPPDASRKRVATAEKPPKLPPINGADKSKKAATVTWTKEEDDHLLDMVFEMKHPLKWSVIAQNLGTNRTGKQCRERYVNHLNPRLKTCDWTPTEDFVIWRLYATIGTQWAKMSKVIPGRTDNGIKNRFHNLKRQLDREEESRIRAPTPDGYEAKVRFNWIREIPPDMRSSIEELWSVERGIGKIAAGTFKTGRDVEEDSNGNRFGPFEKVTTPVQCLRCGLYAPSVQCGDEICTKTEWCRACTDIPMHMSGNTLRECLNLKKIQDQKLVHSLEGLMNGLHVK